MTAISPKFTSETFGPTPDLTAKIRIFEDRELGWRFRAAETLEQYDKHAGYAIISILFAYFEMVAQYQKGESSENGGKAFFRYGVRLVYPASEFLDHELNTIYVRVRCGMYHNGYTRFCTLIDGNYPKALAIECEAVRVNPHLLRADLQKHLESYVATLKDPANTTERENFEKIFDVGLGKTTTTPNKIGRAL